MPNGPSGVGGSRNVVQPGRVNTDTPTTDTSSTTSTGNAGWNRTGPQNTGRTQPTPGTGATTGGLDDGTKALVRQTNEQLKAAQTQLNTLIPQLNQLQGQLTADKKAVPFGESANPFSRGPHEQKVDQDTAKIQALQGQIEGIRSKVGQLDGQIVSAISNALQADPAFKSRGAELTTLNKADAATKQFLGQIDDTKKSLKDALSAINVDSTVNAINSIAGGSDDDLQKGLAAGRDIQKAATLTKANAKYEALGTYADAWKTRIETLTNDHVSTGTTGETGASVNMALPILRPMMDSGFSNMLGAIDNINNASALGKAIGKVEMMHDQVQGYDDTVTSKMRTLQQSQNNQIASTRAQALQ